jgi:hypothetical protein
MKLDLVNDLDLINFNHPLRWRLVLRRSLGNGGIRNLPNDVWFEHVFIRNFIKGLCLYPHQNPSITLCDILVFNAIVTVHLFIKLYSNI